MGQRAGLGGPPRLSAPSCIRGSRRPLHTPLPCAHTVGFPFPQVTQPRRLCRRRGDRRCTPEGWPPHPHRLQEGWEPRESRSRPPPDPGAGESHLQRRCASRGGNAGPDPLTPAGSSGPFPLTGPGDALIRLQTLACLQPTPREGGLLAQVSLWPNPEACGVPDPVTSRPGAPVGVWSSGLWSPQALVKGMTTSWACQAVITGMVQAGGAPPGHLGHRGPLTRDLSPHRTQWAWQALPVGKGPSLPEEAEGGVGKRGPDGLKVQPPSSEPSACLTVPATPSAGTQLGQSEGPFWRLGRAWASDPDSQDVPSGTFSECGTPSLSRALEPPGPPLTATAGAARGPGPTLSAVLRSYAGTGVTRARSSGQGLTQPDCLLQRQISLLSVPLLKMQGMDVPWCRHAVTMATPQPTVSTWQSQHSVVTRWPVHPALHVPKAQGRDHSRSKPVRVTQCEGSVDRGPGPVGPTE